MKKFNFPLHRVLQFRLAEQRVEESRLERVQVELRTAELARLRLDTEERDAGRELLAAREIDGAELAAWEDYRRWVKVEHRRQDQRESDCRRRIAGHIEKLVAKRREVKLLENLKEKKLKRWDGEFTRELEEQAAESYLARWSRA